MPIYTRTGDRGKTSLFSGKRVSKSHVRVETYGTIDELNSLLGVARAHLGKKIHTRYIQTILVDIQKALFYLGSYLADLPDTLADIDIRKQVDLFEKHIDEMTEKLPLLNNFILPGGSVAGATLQHARAVARRAERQLVRLAKKEHIDPDVIKYINRLSDLLFTLARYANHLEKKKETIWSR